MVSALINSHKTKLLRDFVLGQGFAQLIQVVSGFIILRFLSEEQFGILTLAMAFQTTAMLFTEMGVSSAILPLLGSDIRNQGRLEKLMRAAWQIRRRLFLFVGIACLCIIPFAFRQHEIGWGTTIALLVCIIVTLYINGNISIGNVPLRLHKQIRKLYYFQNAGGVIRLIFILTCWGLSCNSAVLIAYLTLAAIGVQAILLKKTLNCNISSKHDLVDSEKNEINKYVRNLTPGIIFFAFQGQILVFAVGMFGNFETLAEMGALARIGMLVAVFEVFNNQIYGPYVSRIASDCLVKKSKLILMTIVGISISIASSGFLFKDLFIWLIGPRYMNLGVYMPLVLATAAIAYLRNSLWQFSHARRWIRWWHGLLEMILVVVSQVLFYCVFGLDTLQMVLLLGLFTAVVTMTVQAVCLVLGFNTNESSLCI